jgi:hypothetical protein
MIMIIITVILFSLLFSYFPLFYYNFILSFYLLILFYFSSLFMILLFINALSLYKRVFYHYFTILLFFPIFT